MVIFGIPHPVYTFNSESRPSKGTSRNQNRAEGKGQPEPARKGRGNREGANAKGTRGRLNKGKETLLSSSLLMSFFLLVLLPLLLSSVSTLLFRNICHEG